MDKFLNNKELNENEIKQKEIVLKSKPRFLMITLTRSCNLDCIMCSRVYAKDNATLPFETIKKIYPLLPYLEGINWQGGEVFLLKHFKDLFMEASKYPNIRQSIITNGLLIDEEWANLFANSRVHLTYSIDAVTKDTYEKIRKNARFENLLQRLEIINGINKRSGSKIELSINAVVMRSNYKELHLFPEFCKDYGFNWIRFDYLRTDRPDLPAEEDIFFLKRDAQIIEYLNRIIHEIEKRSKELNIFFEYTFKPFLSKNDLDSRDSPKIATQDTPLGKQLKCKVPWRMLWIDIEPLGDIKPHCVCSRSIGNIMEESLEEIWNNQVMQSYRKRLREGDISNWCSTDCLNNAVDSSQFEGTC